MAKLIKLETEQGIILIESSISEKTGTGTGTETGTLQQAGAPSEIKKNLAELLDVITPISQSIINSVSKLSKMPDSVTAEYGLGLTVEGNLFVVKVAGEASLKITFTWTPDKKQMREAVG